MEKVSANLTTLEADPSVFGKIFPQVHTFKTVDLTPSVEDFRRMFVCVPKVIHLDMYFVYGGRDEVLPSKVQKGMASLLPTNLKSLTGYFNILGNEFFNVLSNTCLEIEKLQISMNVNRDTLDTLQRRLTRLKEVAICTGGNFSMDDLCNFLQACQSLQTIKIEQNLPVYHNAFRIGQQHMLRIASPSLKCLSIDEPDDDTVIIALASQAPNLEKLAVCIRSSINHNVFSTSALKALGASCKLLNVLEISDFSIKKDFDIQSVPRNIPHLKKLKINFLSRKKLNLYEELLQQINPNLKLICDHIYS